MVTRAYAPTKVGRKAGVSLNAQQKAYTSLATYVVLLLRAVGPRGSVGWRGPLCGGCGGACSYPHPAGLYFRTKLVCQISPSPPPLGVLLNISRRISLVSKPEEGQKNEPNSTCPVHYGTVVGSRACGRSRDARPCVSSFLPVTCWYQSTVMKVALLCPERFIPLKSVFRPSPRAWPRG